MCKKKFKSIHGYNGNILLHYQKIPVFIASCRKEKKKKIKVDPHFFSKIGCTVILFVCLFVCLFFCLLVCLFSFVFILLPVSLYFI